MRIESVARVDGARARTRPGLILSFALDLATLAAAPVGATSAPPRPDPMSLPVATTAQAPLATAYNSLDVPSLTAHMEKYSWQTTLSQASRKRLTLGDRGWIDPQT